MEHQNPKFINLLDVDTTDEDNIPFFKIPSWIDPEGIRLFITEPYSEDEKKNDDHDASDKDKDESSDDLSGSESDYSDSA